MKSSKTRAFISTAVTNEPAKAARQQFNEQAMNPYPSRLMKAKVNPILEELWQAKDALAREADGDVARICENTRRWAAAHPHSGPVVKDATELRAWLARQEEPELSVVREDAPS